jgi:glycosyltransferase involved in cell wall biosynthesis
VLYFDPRDEDAMAEALDRIAEGGLNEAARARAREFTWERAAERSLEAILLSRKGARAAKLT